MARSRRLAPIFAAAFASHKSWEAFLVGLAASIGAGISMAFFRGAFRRRIFDGTGLAMVARRVTGLMTTAAASGILCLS